jgi:hypothetical protein
MQAPFNLQPWGSHLANLSTRRDQAPFTPLHTCGDAAEWGAFRGISLRDGLPDEPLRKCQVRPEGDRFNRPRSTVGLQVEKTMQVGVSTGVKVAVDDMCENGWDGVTMEGVCAALAEDSEMLLQSTPEMLSRFIQE